jgi:drug/metabolite transporter (DMT)-like permease
MKLTKIQLAVLSLIVANLIWGAAPPIFKWSLEDIQPFTLAFLRFSLAAIIIFPFVRKKLKIHNKDWPILIFLSMIGLTFNIAYYFVGLKLSSSINVPIISSAAPIFIIIGSAFFLHEKPKRKIIQGTLVSLIGVLIIVLRPIFENGVDSSLVGNLLFVVSMGLSVFFTLLLKEIAHKYNPLTLTFWIFLITSLSLLPLVFFEASQTTRLLTLDTKSIVGILFGAVLCSIVAYTLEVFAIKYISANEVAVFSYTDPVIAIIIAKPLLGETVTNTFIIGSILVFLGIFISENRLHYHPIHLLRRKPQVETANSEPPGSHT